MSTSNMPHLDQAIYAAIEQVLSRSLPDTNSTWLTSAAHLWVNGDRAALPEKQAESARALLAEAEKALSR